VQLERVRLTDSMCGIAGFLPSAHLADEGNILGIITDMTNAIQKRGPDSSGAWIDPGTGYAVGHRRLSIIDLSTAGHQPMSSVDGRFIITYNGEIYNHEEMRRALEEEQAAPNWVGHSDTEVLLAAIVHWGLKAALGRATGMFALALWDRERCELSLARDRIGEKPLYYGWQGSGASRAFLFGSELKALRAHPAFEGRIDRGALTLFFRHNYVPAPYSIYQGVAKLMPGTILTVSQGEVEPRSESYWSFLSTATTGKRVAFAGSPNEAVDELAKIAGAAVARQMVSDVPLGAFLSGGIDSSTIVALMQAHSAKAVKTFTIGFAEEAYNEAVYAKAVAAHLGTDHHELYVDPDTARAVIPELPSIYCEPFADSSQIPTFLVSRLAREHVTVSLSGDAGDELFCGYNRYVLTSKIWSRINLLPRPLRKAAQSGLTAISPNIWDRLGGTLARKHFAMFGDKVHKGAAVLGSASASELYRRLVSHDDNPSTWIKGGFEPPTALTCEHADLSKLNDIELMMALDGVSYLPDDILAKVDRASMAVSLESRVPFLDHHVVEFAWKLPQSIKLRDGVTKWPLRELLYRYVPRALIERPKMGFGVPINEWLRGPLFVWAEALLDAGRLEREGYWNVTSVRRAWDEHCSGKRNWSAKLWSVLMFQVWLETQRS
jgi:asparagine synthase (glutamine-hydrolysing)